MFKFLFKLKFLGFVEAPVGVFYFNGIIYDWLYLCNNDPYTRGKVIFIPLRLVDNDQTVGTEPREREEVKQAAVIVIDWKLGWKDCKNNSF